MLKKTVLLVSLLIFPLLADASGSSGDAQQEMQGKLLDSSGGRWSSIASTNSSASSDGVSSSMSLMP